MLRLIVKTKDLWVFFCLAIKHRIPITLWGQGWRDCREAHEYQIRVAVNALVAEGKLIRTVDHEGNLWVKDPLNPDDPNSAKKMVQARFAEINERRDQYND